MIFTIFGIMNKSTEHDVCDSFVSIIRGCKDKKTELCKLVFDTYLRECKTHNCKDKPIIYSTQYNTDRKQ